MYCCHIICHRGLYHSNCHTVILPPILALTNDPMWRRSSEGSEDLVINRYAAVDVAQPDVLSFGQFVISLYIVRLQFAIIVCVGQMYNEVFFCFIFADTKAINSKQASPTGSMVIG